MRTAARGGDGADECLASQGWLFSRYIELGLAYTTSYGSVKACLDRIFNWWQALGALPQRMADAVVGTSHT